MTPLIPIALWGFFPLMLLMFAVMPVRRAIMLAYFGGWLFLPLKAFKISGLPEYSKVSAPALVCLLGVMIFRSGPLLKLRPSWMDLPLVMYLVGQVMTSVLTGAGAYEGIAIGANEALLWGVPWILGRAFFADLEGARELAVGFVLAGLVYVPLCLIEIKMSPQLNMWVYGFHQHAFNQTRRMGGWRPMVFMQHGLALGLWMACCATMAWWMWRAKVLPRLAGIGPGAIVGLIFVTSVLCKSTFAMMLMLAAMGILWISQRVGTRWLLVALLASGPVYMVSRTMGDLVLEPVVAGVTAVFGFDRGSSLATRLKNEQLIVDKAMEAPLIGWGGGGKYLVRDPNDPDRILSTPDQFWVIAFGRGGVLGLGSITLVLLLPAAMFFMTCPPRDLNVGPVAAVAALAIVPVLFMLDCLMNAMMNPLFPLASAAVASVTIAARRAAKSGVVVADGYEYPDSMALPA